MAFDEGVAERVRASLAGEADLAEIRMMGALCFTVGGNMCCGVTGDALMVRVGAEGNAAALAEPHTRQMEMGGGRRARGFVCVGPDGFADETALARWVARGLAVARALPAKKPGRATRRG